MLGLMVAARAGLTVVRLAPTWGCGGELSAQTVEALAEVSPSFPNEVRYRAQIEPTFERYVYGPLLRAVLRVADGMKVLQAGSLHAYLAYVLVLSVLLLLWLGGTS